jgi:predicted RNA-binding protein YlqC (UPF0109 family)
MGKEGKYLNTMRIIMDKAGVKISKTQEWADIF